MTLYLKLLGIVRVLGLSKLLHEMFQGNRALRARLRIGKRDNSLAVIMNKVRGRKVAIAGLNARHDDRNAGSDSLIHFGIGERVGFVRERHSDGLLV